MRREDALPMFSYMPNVTTFRDGYRYNNFAYELAGQVIEKVSGMKLDRFLQERVFAPLGLQRTSLGLQPGDTNSAKAYMTLLDGSPVEIPLPFASPDTFMGAAGGIRSSVSDLLVLYQAYLEAGNAELEFGNVPPKKSTNPFKQIGHIWQGKVNLPFQSLREYTYASGWCRTQLPGPLAVPALAETDRSQLPLVGRGSPPRLAIYQEGSISGAGSFAAIFPETQSSVVVLSNSVPLNHDGTRFIGEILIETMFGSDTENINIESILARSEKSAKASTEAISKTKDTLDSQRTVQAATRSLDSYIGRYYNEPETFFLEIRLNETQDGLEMRFYGVLEEAYPLVPYQEDSFTWLVSHDEFSRRGRFCTYPTEYYVMRFIIGDDNQVVSLSWKFDGGVKGEPEHLKRKSTR